HTEHTRLRRLIQIQTTRIVTRSQAQRDDRGATQLGRVHDRHCRLCQQRESTRAGLRTSVGCCAFPERINGNDEEHRLLNMARGLQSPARGPGSVAHAELRAAENVVGVEDRATAWFQRELKREEPANKEDVAGAEEPYGGWNLPAF